jgi:hypothetical protein
MSAGTRPLLLELGGEEAFKAYEKEFGRLYQNRRVYDVLGNRVVFPPNSCWHICYKRDENDRSERRPRDIWSQERAERIPCIMSALNDPRTELRPNDKDPTNKLNYLFVVEADPLAHLPQEYYLAVARRINPTTLSFLTAYPITWREWKEFRDAGPAFYPPKKKKGEQ